MVAKYFQKMNDYNSAIKFLILSNCHDEAFQLASQHGKMELYGEILINTVDDDNARKEDFRSLAMHFESQKNNLLAGKYYFHAKEYQKALRHLLKAAQLITDEDEVLTLAIDTVASSKDDKLANQLIDFLLGGDGVPKVVLYTLPATYCDVKAFCLYVYYLVGSKVSVSIIHGQKTIQRCREDGDHNRERRAN